MYMVSCGTPAIRRRLAIMVPSVMLAVLPVGAQAAVEPGVNYDPASPAGKEYAIPLAQGRAEGAGTQDQQAAANTPFGIGITPPGGGSGRGGTGGEDARAGGTAADAGRGSLGDPATLRTRVGDAEDAGGTAVRWTLGIALALALSAALLTLLVRERHQHRFG